ncbi:MAG: ATP-grasp domain-containing protein [Myxococcales bacterium]|nr:ATP-grasp domain-containing protein [Myxococcales bacterium]
MPEPRPESVLLFGSPSVERRVSVASAQFITGFLDARLWFWTPDGAVIEVSKPELEAHADAFIVDFEPRGIARWASLGTALDTLAPEKTVVVIGAHGGDGEDGTLQALLEARHLAFTGSGSRASARAFDKSQAIAVARQQGVRVPDARAIEGCPAEQARAAVSRAFEELGPLVLKAQAGGSSLLLEFVRTPADFTKAIELLATHGGISFRAEQIIVGREFTVGVIDRGGSPVALPCSEVVMHGDRDFDYDGKYLGAGSEEITPAQIAPELHAQLHELALRLHGALGCEGYSRSDFIVDARGPCFLELNTLPGLSGQSFIPQQLQAAEIDFDRFLDEQIVLAMGKRVRG